MGQRTCEFYQDQRLCEHELHCGAVGMCVLIMERDEAAAHEQEIMTDEEYKRQIEKEAEEYCFRVGF